VAPSSSDRNVKRKSPATAGLFYGPLFGAVVVSADR